MPTPDFILALRAKVGSDLLWLPGVICVVFDDDGRVLLGRRADDGRWTLISGILEPGEQPAVGAVRELEEETGVLAEVDQLVDVRADRATSYPNGDRVQFLTLTFRCTYRSGQARVNDDESTEVGWFALDGLPELPDYHLSRIHAARTSDGVAQFIR